jgi:uncharacterized SAM-binding protein YcdF (DUF218 family)
VSHDGSTAGRPKARPPRRRATGDLRGCRILGGVALATLALVVLTPAIGWVARRYAEPARLVPAQAIVVLGGHLGPDGRLNTSSWRRLVHGILLYRQGLAPLLVLNGSTPARGPSEAEVRARTARELGVPSAAILAVTGANTTRDEAVRVSAELRARGIRSILLVTGPLHLVRARAVFERQGLEVRAAPSADFSLQPRQPQERLELTQALAQELLARLYYRLAGYL